MIRHLTIREKKISIITVLAVVFCLFYNVIIAPLQNKKDLLDEEIMMQEAGVARDSLILRESEGIDRPYNFYMARFSRSGTDEEIAASILSEIEETAGTLGLHVSDLKPRKVMRSEYDHQFFVSLTISGELLDISHFLYTLQQAPHLFDVEEIELEKFARESQPGITTRLILGKAFIPSDPDKGKFGENTTAPINEWN